MVDGVELNRKYPDTFWIPSDNEKAQIKPGDNCKLIFEHIDGRGGERMWVRVTAVAEQGLRGTLNNIPSPDLAQYGDSVDFELRHVIQIIPG